MSYADKIYIENAKEIIEHGFSTMNQKVRAKWEDGSPAYTYMTFGVCNTYDLRKEFPTITLRRTALKSCFDEILWIFQKKSNNIKDLKPHIWDEWADIDGSIGKAYGYQIAQKHFHHKESLDDRQNFSKYVSQYPSYSLGKLDGIYMDQIDSVIYDLKHDPFSRRIMTSLWNLDDLSEMNLQPCCWSLTFVTTKEDDELVLNCVLNQRSNDFLAANNWNVAQYAILLMMIAQCVGMKAGKLTHMIANQHIYDKHIDIVKELIERPTYPAPKVSLNPDKTNFYDFTTDDLIVEDYRHGEQVQIPIAI